MSHVTEKDSLEVCHVLDRQNGVELLVAETELEEVLVLETAEKNLVLSRHVAVATLTKPEDFFEVVIVLETLEINHNLKIFG